MKNAPFAPLCRLLAACFSVLATSLAAPSPGGGIRGAMLRSPVAAWRGARLCGHVFLLLGLLPGVWSMKAQTVTQWRPHLEWSRTYTGWSNNPFDVEAYVTVTHTSTGATHRTGMFYDGNNTWKWRFTGTIPGQWTYRSHSSHGPLDGLTGSLVVTEQVVDGMLQRMDGDKWGWTGTNRAVTPHLVMLEQTPSNYNSPAKRAALLDEFIDGHGFTGVNLNSMAAFWFKHNANGNRFSSNSDLNDSKTSPDPETFRALEGLIIDAHARGAQVHLWMWGARSATRP